MEGYLYVQGHPSVTSWPFVVPRASRKPSQSLEPTRPVVSGSQTLTSLNVSRVSLHNRKCARGIDVVFYYTHRYEAEYKIQ